jgi:hypothetical protein
VTCTPKRCRQCCWSIYTHPSVANNVARAATRTQALQTMLLEQRHTHPRVADNAAKAATRTQGAADNAATTRIQAQQTMLQKQRRTPKSSRQCCKSSDTHPSAADTTQAQQTMLHESYNNHPLSNCHRSSINSYYCCTSAAETLNQRQMTAPQLQNQQPRREVQARPHAASSTTADNFFADGILYKHKYYNLRAKKYIHYNKHDK